MIKQRLRKVKIIQLRLKEFGPGKTIWGFPGGGRGKELVCQRQKCKRHRFHLWVGKIPWRRAWQSTSVFLPGESHGQRSLVGCSPCGLKELDMTEVT